MKTNAFQHLIMYLNLLPWISYQKLRYLRFGVGNVCCDTEIFGNIFHGEMFIFLVPVWRLRLWNCFHTLANGILALLSCISIRKNSGNDVDGQKTVKNRILRRSISCVCVRLCLWTRTEELNCSFSENLGA